MQNRRSWEGGSQSELEDVCRCEVATRSFIEAGWSTYARADYVAKEPGRSRSLVFANGPRFSGSDATLVHLRDLWHVCACAIASTGVFCNTFVSKAFR